MIVTCAHCGGDANIRPAKLKASNFCSAACYHTDSRNEVVVNCTNCGNELERKPCTTHEENFCDLKCRSEFRCGKNHPRHVEYAVKKCEECGSEIPRHIAKRDYAKYCSNVCKVKAVRGAAASGWKGGVWVYGSGFTKTFKDKIRARDGDKCATCGIVPEEKRCLQVHHIDGNKKNNDPNNLITQCTKCHAQIYKKMKAHSFTKRLGV